MTATPFHAYYTARILDSLQDDDKFIPTFASSDIKVYNFNSFCSFFICKVASVLVHDFVIWIYGFFRILFPFSIKNIRLCEFKCCYLILLCSGVCEPSLECITIFCWYVTFKVDALAVPFCYRSDKATTIRCEG